MSVGEGAMVRVVKKDYNDLKWTMMTSDAWIPGVCRVRVTCTWCRNHNNNHKMTQVKSSIHDRLLQKKTHKMYSRAFFLWYTVFLCFFVALYLLEPLNFWYFSFGDVNFCRKTHLKVKKYVILLNTEINYILSNADHVLFYDFILKSTMCFINETSWSKGGHCPLSVHLLIIESACFLDDDQWSAAVSGSPNYKDVLNDTR